MLRLKIVACICVVGIIGVACLLVYNSEQHENQSARFVNDKVYDNLEEQNDQSSDQESRDSPEKKPKGESVWLLRHIGDEGDPRQWALYKLGRVYELCVVRNAPFRNSIICSPWFEAHVTDGIRLHTRTGFHHMSPERPCVGLSFTWPTTLSVATSAWLG